MKLMHVINYDDNNKIYEDSKFNIELNDNYPKDEANAFLCIIDDDVCIGGVDFHRHKDGGKWSVSIDKPYDHETDSDAELIGYYDTQKEALKVLWDNRESAYQAVPRSSN